MDYLICVSSLAIHFYNPKVALGFGTPRTETRGADNEHCRKTGPDSSFLI